MVGVPAAGLVLAALVASLAASAGTPDAEAFSGSRAKIAFASDRDFVGETHGNFIGEIYVMNPTGSARQRLTRSRASELSPAWSPDRRRIAFVRAIPDSQRFGFTEEAIYVMNSNGSGERRLTSRGSLANEPVWSPDGQRIAFASDRDGNYEIYVMNTDGSSQRRLTQNRVWDSHPSWSPDGRKIAFASDRSGKFAKSDIYVMSADGSFPRRLTRSPASDRAPDWSPDGRTIAFTSDRDGNDEIYLMNASGRASRRLTRSRAFDSSPSWSPDGRRIAFASEPQTAKTDIWVMDADGSRSRRLTQNAGWDEDAAW
jgi:Tol biopolymer transport system component